MYSSKLLLFTFFLSISFSYAQAPANNICTNAEPITVSASEPQTLEADFTEATVSVNASCDTFSFVNKDVWYQFVMPIDGAFYIDGANSFENFSLYNTCGGEEIACNIGGAVFGNLVNGNSYLLRISYRFSGTRNFTFQAFSQALNDDCENKETITLSATTFTDVSVDSRTASKSVTSSCESSTRSYTDLWYDFVMPVAGNLTITPTKSSQIYSLYDACSGTELQCLPSSRNNTLFFLDLSLDATYILRVANDVQSAGIIDFKMQPLANASNNDCTNAETITIPTTEALTINADFTNTNESLDASCNTASFNNYDLWYQFVMPIDGNVFIDGRSSLSSFTLYNTCGGAEIACTQSDASFKNLINGNTYILRVSYRNNSEQPFTIQAIVPAANDECDNRENLVLSTTTAVQPKPDSKMASLSVDATCDSSPTFEYTDLWYEFVMPVNGNLNITSTTSRQTFSLYDGCSGAELQCFNGSNLVLFKNLSINTSYVLRVAQFVDNAGIMDFEIQPLAFSTNDECSGSETLIIETENPITYNVDLLSATESVEEPCRSTGARTSYDLWYNFTMPVTGSIKIDDIGNGDVVTAYDACGGSVLSCQSGVQFITGLIAGQNYILRIASIVQSNKALKFQAFAAAANDACDNSETITVTTNNALSYEADTRFASESLKASCESTSSNQLDLWYDFEMPVTGNIQISGVNAFLTMSLFDACSGKELGCFSRNGTFTNLGLNGNYKLKISQTARYANIINFNIQAFENLFNDECSTPQDITIPVSGFATFSTNNAAATSSETTTCERSGTINDVWYRFTMPNDADIEIDNLTSTITGYFALYDACGTTELQCFINDGLFTGLTPGNEYLLKVGSLSSQSGVLSFNISTKIMSLSIEKLAYENLLLYPNPASDVLRIEGAEKMNLETLSILDLNGRLVKTVPLQGSLKTIDISNVMPSVYIILIELDNKRLIRRFVKQ